MEEVFKRTMFLEMNNYPKDYKECLIQAIRELIPDYYLKDIFTIFGITYNEYIEDMANSYIRYKSQKVGDLCQR